MTSPINKPVFACFEDIEKNLGPVFALVNNAGLVDQRPFEDNTPEQIDKIMQVNVNGSIYCAQGALKSMKSLGDGRIINSLLEIRQNRFGSHGALFCRQGRDYFADSCLGLRVCRQEY